MGECDQTGEGGNEGEGGYTGKESYTVDGGQRERLEEIGRLDGEGY